MGAAIKWMRYYVATNRASHPIGLVSEMALDSEMGGRFFPLEGVRDELFYVSICNYKIAYSPPHYFRSSPFFYARRKVC